MTTKLLKLMPPHHTYVEPFGGGASLLFAKNPSPVEVYNDLDSGLVGFFRVLRDPEKFERLRHLASLTPYSREEYYYCRDTWEKCEDEVERAYRWFVVARMSFSGCFSHSWSFSVSISRRGMAQTCSKWLSAIEGLPMVHERLMQVQIEHNDFRQIFIAYDTPKTLFYADPPYVSETRSATKYKHELSEADHRELVEILLGLKGMVMLSGYNHSIYEPLEAVGWWRQDYQTVCHAAARTKGTGIQGKGAALKMQPRTESVWLNPRATEGREARLF